ncbi:helix-turn-helix domain-containing protein [Umezawaea tangerina]|uniref:Regulatory LuxR family protein n=1 Tax=Umezawaea tangerina TaxID=84725 RepID=A0A2T0SSI8_9PSEU|nr:helix-turn-helix transcriptional regulator [Umezawaea tangerina]PRY36370.1 regulatory LuxR family protein [Umezawaea tangerina]
MTIPLPRTEHAADPGAGLREARIALDEDRAGDALEFAEKALAAYSWLEDAEGAAECLLAQSVALGGRGLLSGALDTIDQVRRIAVANRRVRLQSWCGYSRAVVELRLDSPERSLRSLARALGPAELSGDPELIGSILFEQAKVLRGAGSGERDLRRAEALCAQVRDRWRQLDDVVRQARVTVLLAHVRLDLGEVERARRSCRRAEELLAGQDRPVAQAELLLAQARVSGARDRVGEQVARLGRAAEIAAGCRAREVAVRAHGELSAAYERAGQLGPALRHARAQLEQHRLRDRQDGVDLLRMREHDLTAGLARLSFGPAGREPVRPGHVTAERTDSRIARALRAGLTKRGIEVLQLLVSGAGTNTIADRLALSPKTVQNHLQRIYRTLGVHDRAGAVVWWIDLDPEAVGAPRQPVG